MVKHKLVQAANLPRQPDPAPPRPLVPGPMTGAGTARSFVSRFAEDADYEELKAKIMKRQGDQLARSYWRCPRCHRYFDLPASESGKAGGPCFGCNAGFLPGGAHLVELKTPAEIAGYHSAVKRDNERWKAGAATRKAKLADFNDRIRQGLPR